MSRLTVPLGVAAVGLGAAVVLRPELAAGTSTMSLLVLFVGLLALTEGARAAVERVRSSRRQAALPGVERPREYATPGDDADAALERLSRRPGRERDEVLARMRERVREAAVATLVAERYTESEADAALAEGTWTDDLHAAALFASPSVPLGERLRGAFRREPPHRLRLRRAIAVLHERNRRNGGGDGD